MANVRYIFTAQGHQVVANAFNSIRSAAVRTATSVRSLAAATATTQVAAIRKVAAAQQATERKKASAAQRAAKMRMSATIKALNVERQMLRKMLAEYEAFEKRKTAAAQREGNKRAAAGARSRRRGGVLGGIGRFGGRVGRTVGAFAAMGAGIAIAGGVGAAVRENIRIEDLSRDIAIRGRDPGGARVNARAISDAARRTAMRTPGARGEDVLGGVSEFLEKTGDLEAAQRASGIIADIAIATGSDMKEVAGAAASLFMQFGTGSKSMEDMRQQLSLFVMQGKKGAFEMRDMAKGIERMATAAKVLGVRGDVEQVATVGALAQFARRASGGPERAVTSLEGAFNILMRKQALIKRRHGIDVGAIAKDDLATLFPKIFESIKGDSEVLGKLFSKRALTGVIDLFNKFKELEQETGSQAEASAQLTDIIRQMASAEGAAKDVAMDLADAQGTARSKLDAAWEKIVQTFGSGEGLEAINSLIDLVVALAPAFAVLSTVIEGMTTTLTGLIWGVASFSDKVFGTKLVEGLTKDRDIQRARKEMHGQAQVVGQYEKLIKEAGYEPGQMIPKRLVGTPHEAEYRRLQEGYSVSKEIRDKKTAELVRLVGGKKNLTPSERAQLEEREKAYTEFLHSGLGYMPEDESQRIDPETGLPLRPKKEVPWQIPGLEGEELAKEQQRQRAKYAAFMGGGEGGEGMGKAASETAGALKKAAGDISGSGIAEAAKNAADALNEVKPPGGGGGGDKKESGDVNPIP